MASSADPSLVADRLRTALDLMATGVEMTRQRLRREFPSATAQEIATQMGTELLLNRLARRGLR